MLKKIFLLTLMAIILIVTSTIGCVDEDDKDEVILTITSNDITLEYSLDDFETLDSYNDTGRYINKLGIISNSSSFTGVRISKILDEFSNLPDYYNISIVASDGYEIIYTMDDIYGNLDIYDEEGNILANETAVMILAYKEDGKYYSEIDTENKIGPLRVAFVDDDVITSSNLWLKMVVSIEVISI